jgi:hypothetical protein
MQGGEQIGKARLRNGKPAEFLKLKVLCSNSSLSHPFFFVCLNFQTATNNLDGILIIIANRCKNMYEWKFLIVSFF